VRDTFSRDSATRDRPRGDAVKKIRATTRWPAGLDNTKCGHTVNLVIPNTHQQSSFRVRLHLAAAAACYLRLCPARPGAAS
jgi:hypothetical protein